MNEMANLYPSRTGVNYVMWFGEVGGQHGPRIKVSNEKGKFAIHSNFTLSVSKTPEVMTPEGSVHISERDLNKIKEWIVQNHDNLMLLWRVHETGDAVLVKNEQTGHEELKTAEDILMDLTKV